MFSAVWSSFSAKTMFWAACIALLPLGPENRYDAAVLIPSTKLLLSGVCMALTCFGFSRVHTHTHTQASSTPDTSNCWSDCIKGLTHTS